MIKEVLLVVSILMGPGSPDAMHREVVPDMATCLKMLTEFLSTELTEQMRQAGGVGKAAFCAYKEKPSQAN